MGKNNFFKSLLFVAVFAAALGACRSDELAVRDQNSSQTAGTQRADSFSVELSLGDVPFESRITAVDDIAKPDEEPSNGEGRATRAALVVGDGGKTTINLTLGKKKDVDVCLILRNGDGSRIAVANSTWSAVEGETTKLKTNGQYNFSWVKGSGSALSEDETWYLDAMTGGTWDASTKSYNINKDCTLPSKMFNPGEHVELGKHIHVPFSLGTNAWGNDRKWGVKVYVVNGSREAGSFVPRLVCLDPEPTFSPYGSLLCMRFRNGMGVQNTPNLKLDPLLNRRRAVPSNFSFVLRKVRVESTSSTTGGCIKVAELGSPNRQILPWHGYRPGGGYYTYTANHQEPFKSENYFDKAKENDKKTGYFLAKGKTNGEAGAWTPYYYLWVKSIDENQTRPLFGSSGLKVSCTMYNYTVRPDELGTTGRNTSFSRVFVSSKKVHKSSHAYFADRSLDGEIFLPATFYMAPAVLYNHPTRGFTWPDSIASNKDVAERSRMSFKEFWSRFGGREDFTVNTYGKNDNVGHDSRIKWIIPSRMMVQSVFPPGIPGINVGAAYKEGKMEKVHEKVSINGRIVEADSYYYNPWPYNREQSQQPRNYHVYYAIRFVGTPYCEAVRYTLYGQWDAPARVGDIPGASRFIFHSKHLGETSFTDQEAKDFFEQELKSPVQPSYNPPPVGTPPSNKFWGDFWHPSPDGDVSMTILHPGGRFGLFGSGNGAIDLGRAITIAAIEGGSMTDFEHLRTSGCEITDANRVENPYDFRDWNTNRARLVGSKATVVPFMSPIAYDDEPFEGERH